MEKDRIQALEKIVQIFVDAISFAYWLFYSMQRLESEKQKEPKGGKQRAKKEKARWVDLYARREEILLVALL
jgi:hypothetical protein